MPEGVAVTGGQVVGEPTFDDPKTPPPDDPKAAPLGWTWSRSERKWRAKKVAGRGGRTTTSAAPAEPQAAQAPQAGQDRGGKDPDPAWFQDRESRDDVGGGRQLSFDEVPQQVRDDIAGFAGLVGAPVLAMLQAADPYCGTALAQAFEPIIDATLPLMCRSERIVAYFTGDKSDWLLWGKLAMALAPVARAIYAHHIAHSVEVVRDPATGQVQFVPVNRGQSEHGDHLTPPQQPEFHYAA